MSKRPILRVVRLEIFGENFQEISGNLIIIFHDQMKQKNFKLICIYCKETDN